MAHIVVDDNNHLNLKRECLNRKMTANEYISYLIDLDKRNRKIAKEIHKLEKGEVYSYEFPDRLVTLQCEGNFARTN